MPDWIDSPLTPETPATPPPSPPRRTQRSGLPDGAEDGRATAGIEALDQGPDADDGRHPGNGGSRADAEAAALRRRPFVLDTRPDWTIAVRHEDARHVRYGRPVSVLLLELTGEVHGPELDRMARDVADLIRTQARATDRAVRLAPGSFRILMPETGERPARAAADRLEHAYRAAGADRQVEDIRIEVAAPSRARSLEDALAEAEERLRLPEPRPEPRVSQPGAT